MKIGMVEKKICPKTGKKHKIMRDTTIDYYCMDCKEWFRIYEQLRDDGEII